MSKNIKTVAALGLIVLIAACARSEPAQEEFVIVDPEPMSQEPAFTGKFK
ncbi:hypothetical protein [Algirhabdus cladophorae]